jgi:hypothetical protein
MAHHEDDEHYRRYREEMERRLDADWRALQQSRAAGNAPLAPRNENPPQSMGRAVAEVFTAPEPDPTLHRPPSGT